MLVGTQELADELGITTNTVRDVAYRYGHLIKVERGEGNCLMINHEQFLSVYFDPNRGFTRCGGCGKRVRNTHYKTHTESCKRRARRTRCLSCEILVFPADEFPTNGNRQQQEDHEGYCPVCYARITPQTP